jgi:hypothetical protein
MLARGKPGGAALLAVPGLDAWSEAGRSFWAVVLSLPAFVALRAMDWAVAGMPEGAALGFTRALLGLVIEWIGFLVLMHLVCRRQRRAALWPGFVIAWNWCSLLQALVAVAAALPGVLGAPGWVDDTARLAVAGWSLWLGWFVARLALGLPGFMAAAVVALDLALELAITGLVGG